MIDMETRKKIIEARKNGKKILDISREYAVSESAIYRILRRERETGDITPKTHLRGRKPTLDQAGLENLKALILAKPDITLQGIKEEMGLSLGNSAISVIVREKLGFQYKKRLYTLREEST